MKKCVLLFLCVCLAAPFSAAQQNVTTQEWYEFSEGTDSLGHYIEQTKHEKGVTVASRKWKNWTTTANIGFQAYVGDNDWKAKFKDWWTGPSVDVFMNKWISPSFGLGFGFTYSPTKGLYQYGTDRSAFMTDIYYGEYKDQQLYCQRGQTFNPFVTALVDLDNLILGFDPERIINLAVYAGGGVIFGQDPIQTRCGATFNMGFMNIFRVCRNFDLILNLRGSLVSDSFDGESRLTERQTVESIRKNQPYDVTGGISAGIVYHFGTKDKTKEWQNVSNVTKTYTGYADALEEINHLKEELAKSQAENEQLRKDKQTRIVIKDPSHLWYHVQFKIDKWDISNRELVNLKSIAETIRMAGADTKFSICGYADVQTATPEHNLMLSRNRVNRVFDVLTKEFGVNPDQLVKDYKGGVDLMFYQDNRLSRCVIIKSLSPSYQPF